MDEAFWVELENAGMEDIVWRIDDSENGEFPEVYAYKKLYSENYRECVGYIEIRLASGMLADYFKMVENLAYDSKADLSLYYKDELIYSASGAEYRGDSVKDIVSGCEINVLGGKYQNCLKIPILDLCLIRTGRLKDIRILPTKNMPGLLLSLIFVLLIILFVSFFANIVSLSKRILEFSSFIRNSDPNNLSQFNRISQQEDELSVLIDTYNTLTISSGGNCCYTVYQKWICYRNRLRSDNNQLINIGNRRTIKLIFSGQYFIQRTITIA